MRCWAGAWRSPDSSLPHALPAHTWTGRQRHAGAGQARGVLVAGRPAKEDLYRALITRRDCPRVVRELRRAAREPFRDWLGHHQLTYTDRHLTQPLPHLPTPSPAADPSKRWGRSFVPLTGPTTHCSCFSCSRLAWDWGGDRETSLPPSGNLTLTPGQLWPSLLHSVSP